MVLLSEELSIVARERNWTLVLEWLVSSLPDRSPEILPDRHPRWSQFVRSSARRDPCAGDGSDDFGEWAHGSASRRFLASRNACVVA
ncbi:hypothetical protein GV794_12785 [Nocardia cyriacigeorgica]|uniref:Uncharacterized protein n=1 Tax=Nocardia cyriacigeorgica TaxID=135487 RepID=A0A6P1D3D0_9NOCA|nr:hypothetical protein [Nocardia cyriacigeorgica]NEW39560.1 hypothetical protein [Nocardia cyriacigeorgica]NEW43974.1 hypothetical protein [Nocardia cyriacigeorgica]NEW50049.1 hypothetical protein [Nocardia cyriacigeorgica]NEW56522.1 hypothetical protein [Nocardia cyriacigeorgica]